MHSTLVRDFMLRSSPRTNKLHIVFRVWNSNISNGMLPTVVTACFFAKSAAVREAEN